MKPIHYVIATFIAAVWGVNFIFIHMALVDIPPFMLCTLRFLLTALPAVFFIKPPAIPFKMLCLYGFFMFFVQFSFLFLGMYAGVAPGLASLIVQVQLFFSLFFAIFLLKEKLTIWPILGAVLAFSGIALIGVHTGGDISLTGLCCVLMGAASWGMANVIVKKIGQVNTAALVAWGSLLTFPFLFLISLYIEGPKSITYALSHFSLTDLLAILFIAYGATWFGYGTWSWLIKQYPVYKVTPFSLLVPLFGMLSAALFYNEAMEPWKIFSATLIIAGLCVHLFGKRLLLIFKSEPQPPMIIPAP